MTLATGHLVLWLNVLDSAVLTVGTLRIPQELVAGLPTEPHVRRNIRTIILTRIKLIIEANQLGVHGKLIGLVSCRWKQKLETSR